jgi:hypothetical protein
MPANANNRPDLPAEHAARVMTSLSNHLAREYDIPPPGETRRRGFPHLVCILCGRRDGLVVCLGDTRRIRCLRCGEEISVEAVKNVLAAWADVVEWLENAPICSEG